MAWSRRPAAALLRHTPERRPTPRKSTTGDAPLRISAPGDASERTADRVAETITGQRPSAPVSATARKSDGLLPSPAVAAELARARSTNGEPLPPAVARDFARHLGPGIDRVRVHRDERAGQLADLLHARAFTFRGDVFFGRGELQPETPDGRRLLAHEVAHATQHRAQDHETARDQQAEVHRESKPGEGPLDFLERKRQGAARFLLEKAIAAARVSMDAAFAGLRSLGARLPASTRPFVDPILSVAHDVIETLIVMLLAVAGIVIGFGEGVTSMIIGIGRLLTAVLGQVVAFVKALLTGDTSDLATFNDVLNALKKMVVGLKAAATRWIDRFQKASPLESAALVGEMTGEILALIASFAVGGGAAGAVGRTGAAVGARVGAAVETLAGGARVLAGGGLEAPALAGAASRVTATVIEQGAAATVAGTLAATGPTAVFSTSLGDKGTSGAGKGSPGAMRKWVDGLKKTKTPTTTKANQYEVKVAGPDNFEVAGGGVRVSADGVSVAETKLLEAKFIDKPGRSPYVADSQVPEFIRENAVAQVNDEFSRYARVIADPEVPASALEVIVSDQRAVPFFESLLKKHGIPGRVRVEAP